MQWRKDSLFNKECWENLGRCMWKKEMRTLPNIININSKWSKGLNTRSDT